MDFASLMTKEIAKVGSTSTTNADSKPAKEQQSTQEKSKYLKKADIEREREEKYRQEQAALKKEQEEKLQRKRRIEEDETIRKRERDEKRRRLAEESRLRREEEEAKKERARRKRLGLPEIPPAKDADGNPNSTDESKASEQDDTTIIQPSQQDLDLPIPTTLALLPESELRVPGTPPKDTSTHPHIYRQLVSYFTLLLRAWRDALASRPPSIATSTSGKQALLAYTNSLTNLRPLFTQFERATLPPHLLSAVLEIVSAAQDRRYVDANDAYLRLSIGKAAWPIGVTMVGIHERSAREKLSEHNKDGVAHIMADEGTRKWLQSLKRCLSFAQTRWPPEDVGQMMG